MITPDNKGILLTERGKVKRLLFDDEHCCVKTLIEHPCATKNFPLIAMAKKKDGSLIIVSAGNYKNAKNNNKIAEYILYHNEWSKVKKLEEPIQAISLDSSGKKLAIATQYYVKIIDLKTDREDEVSFQELNKNNNWIVDIAVDKKGDSIIGVGSQNGVQLMSLIKNDNKLDLATLKQVKNVEVIKKIYYPTLAELLYLTQDGKAKIIDMYDLLEPNGEYVKTTDFSQPFGYDRVVADSTDYITTAHWAEKNSKIEIYRKNHSCVERFILEISSLQDRYDYIGKCGQYTSDTGHILHVAICGKLVIVLTTDGGMRLWSLPEERYIYSQTNKEELLKQVAELNPNDFVETTERKGRSNSPEKNYKFSDPHNKQMFVATDTEDIKKRKGFSRIKVFTTSRENNLGGKKSRENSPIRKRLSEKNSKINSSKPDNLVDFKEIDGEEI